MRTVLLADPNAVHRSLIREQLIEYGCTPIVEAGLLQAIRSFIEFRPQIVLLDRALPGLEDFELFRARRSAAMTTPYVVVMTPIDAIRPSVKVDEWLTEPVRGRALVGMLDRAEVEIQARTGELLPPRRIPGLPLFSPQRAAS